MASSGTVLPVLAILSCVASCTLVLEDREDCPCLLEVYLEDAPALPVQLRLETEDFTMDGSFEMEAHYPLYMDEEGP